MQLNFRLVPVLTLAFITTFTACKKDTTTDTNESSATEIKTHADDQNRVSAELDLAATEVTAAMESNASFGGRLSNGQNTTSICGATATADTASNPKTITISYNGNNCAGTHFRSGSIIVSMPSGIRWRDAGAAITVNFQNFKIKRLADNKSITINGSQTFTNVSGGLLIHLSNLQTITHTITSSNMSITFDDSTQRNWQVARKRVFTFNNGVVLSVHGIGTSGNITNAAEWGTNRFGHSFTTSITAPLVFRQDCAARLTAGQITHNGFATSTATFGLDASGAPTTCPAGSYYYKLTWTGPGGNTQTVILPY